MKKSFFKSKKFKYGSVATAITVLTIVLVMVVNIIFSTFAARFMWYSDMTNSDIFTLSDALEDVIGPTLDEVASSGRELKIIFCADPDEIESGSTEYMPYIYKTAKLLEAKFDAVKVECHDVIKEYNFFKKYANTAASNIYTTSIILECGDEFRLMAPETFFIFDSEDTTKAWAYNGEKKFAAQILQIASTENPLVCFTTEHGETLAADAASLRALFEDAGFEVRSIDLSKESVPDDCRIVVINNPKYDFIGMEAESEEANEIAKLDAFLDRLGALMVFEDYRSAADHVNLNEFLEEWGISYDAGAYLVDYEHSTSVDGSTIVAEYEESGLGASIYDDMTTLDTMPRTLSKNSMPIDLLFTEKATESGTKQVYSVLSSYDTAECIRGGVTESTGSRTLMAISREKVIVNNEQSLTADHVYSYVIACGAPSFVKNDYITSKSYGNQDIVYSAMRAVGRENLLADLAYKEFDDVELTITTAQAMRWTVTFTVLPPLVIAVCGVVVRIKRKNS